ncbi:MAG: IS1595 family transposase, partial [Omnitrophica bacterium]|nr:IS1595 family transposase [Candidatus Omnitrophota bacterium]
KGISAKQVSRTLGVSYKTAWKMVHKIRDSIRMYHKDFKGTVEMDETYVGGERTRGRFGKGTTKACVVVILERMGKARTYILKRVNKRGLHTIANKYINKSSSFMTDDLNLYRGLKFDGGHQVVKHSHKEYVRGDVHTNTAESYFSLVKRSVRGTYHHISKKHLRKYLNEFEFRWNWRKIEDEILVRIAVKFGLSG